MHKDVAFFDSQLPLLRKAPVVTPPPSPEPISFPALNDAFYLRLTVAILYRAGLDAMDELSPDAKEAQEFLRSEFASLALKVLRAEIVDGRDWGDISDYVGHIQRVVRSRIATSETAQRVNAVLEEHNTDDDAWR